LALQKAVYMDHCVLGLCRCVCASEVSTAYFRWGKGRKENIPTWWAFHVGKAHT